MNPDGMTIVPSAFGPDETLNRLTSALTARGLTIFARIDHAAGAADAGLSLGPTTVLVFGNAKGGTPLMQINQTIGIDLPLKALVWQDRAGKTFVGYNEPAWLAHRHGLGHDAGPPLAGLGSALKALAAEATGA